ncbi:MAG: hypothetical protein AB1758_32215, partial [Candidatus Eremiobacterota bacterium]
MARFLLFVIFLVGVGALVLFGWNSAGSGRPLPVPTPTESHRVRVALSGRPSGLPVRALKRMPDLGTTTVDIQVIEDPGLRWRMLAAGEVDLVLCSLDDFALAVPRHNPGVLLFPVARSVGSDAVVTRLDESATAMRVAYVEGTPGHYQVALLRARRPEWRLEPLAASTTQQAREWYDGGAVQAVALWEPWVSRWTGNRGRVLLQSSEAEPITDVWVASRQSLRGERAPRVLRQ